MKNESRKPTIITKPHYRSDSPFLAGLTAPDIPVAFHDTDNPGLLPISALENPVVVTLEVWPGARVGYTYQLYWDNKEHGPEKPITEDHQPGDPLSLEIPVDLLTEGSHSLQYRTYNPSSQVVNLSEIFTAVIDKTAPGSPELSQMQFPPEVQNGLTAAELAQLGGKLEVNIAGYTGMAKHDEVKTFWGAEEGPGAIVDADDMGLNRITITFSQEFLEAQGDGEQSVKYHVFDRAGNKSIDSNPVPITLLLEEVPSNFPAPIIDPAVGGLIDYAEAQAGVQVDIPHYTGASAFDQIQLFWGETNPLLPVQLPPGNEDEDIVLSLRVPFDVINALPPGQVRVSYRVFRQGTHVGSSLHHGIDVFLTLPVVEPLNALVVQGTSVENPNTTDNFIDEDDYELNGRAIVTWTDEFQISDDLNLFWGEQQKLQWYQIKSSDVNAGRNLAIPIDNAIMKAQGTGAEVPVYFSVTRTGNPNPAKCPVQLVTVRSKEELPGGGDGLEGPPFNLNSGGFIGPILNPNGAKIKISPYINIAKDQKITLTFKGFDDDNNPITSADYTASRELDENDVLNGYTFTVPHRNLRTICTGFAEASFKVEPPAGSNQSPVNSKVTRAPVHMLDSVELTCTIR
jgi:hypothetical protein